MKLLYIADGRSPTALNWINYFIRAGQDVHLVSTFPCAAVDGVASQHVIPVAMSNFYEQPDHNGKGKLSFLRKLLPVNVRTLMRQLAVPLSFPHVTSTLQGIIDKIQPDLIHAMRIPYEGMITTQALRQFERRRSDIRRPPFLVSVWGNDFTLHAGSTPMMAWYTRQTLQSCDALHTDCLRDQRLAFEMGYESKKPAIVMPGGGGIQLDVFYPAEAAQNMSGVPTNHLTIINPRGTRAYVRNDTFFKAIPAVVEKHPQVQFICPGMKDEEQAHRWIRKLEIGDRVQLLAPQSRQEMAHLFRRAMITLSVTTHDGTPNSLLEAMACGCFPIAGDIEALREWITPGVNGLLVDPGDPDALSAAILEAVAKPEMRSEARQRNLELVRERAEYVKCMRAAEEFYKELIGDIP